MIKNLLQRLLNPKNPHYTNDIRKEAAKEIKRLREKCPIIDFTSWFYRNCKTQRRRQAKICGCCPFRSFIESVEAEKGNE